MFVGLFVSVTKQVGQKKIGCLPFTAITKCDLQDLKVEIQSFN